ncbi:MAG: ABC transporter ATP-binding protein [Planctomycetota bacterium]
MPRLNAEHLCKSFPTAGEPLEVLSDLSLRLDAGQSAAIVGPSGSGKSTLLQILGALDRPDSGTLRIGETDPLSLDVKRLAAFRNRSVGFVFQDHHLLPGLSVMENVLVPCLASGRPNGEQSDRAAGLLESVGLGDRLDHLPSELSGGERERVAISRALVMQPQLILADEPTGNLDRRTADSVTELLLRLQGELDAVLVCVTHSDSLAQAMQQRFELVDGKLCP